MTQGTARGPLIYVVEDESTISQMVALNLTNRGYRVKRFSEGTHVLESLTREFPDLMILDIMMPGANGLEVARQVRQHSQVPILVLSVRNEVSVKLAALNMGADDYLTKPFRVEELLARVRAILRRTGQSRSALSRTVYQKGDLCVDLDTNQVTVNGYPVKLTPQEWALLRTLVEQAGQVITPRQLLQKAWGPEYGDENDYIRAYVSRLRRKLKDDPRRPRYVLLERGSGYRLAQPD